MMDQVQDIILPSCLDLTLYVPLQCHKQMHMLDATWRNVMSARSHDTAVRPIVYKHGRMGGYVTK